MTFKTMYRGFKKFLFPSPISEDVECCKDDVTEYAVTPEAFDSAVKAELENAKNNEVKKCKRCGKELEDNQKDFCSEYCKYMDLWLEHCEKKYGKAICGVCGVEFVKTYWTQYACSVECQNKQLEILQVKKELSLPEIKDEDNLQNSELNCVVCGEPIGQLFTKRDGDYCFCSSNCLKHYQNHGREYYGKAICPQCNNVFMKHHPSQKYCCSNCRELYYRYNE